MKAKPSNLKYTDMCIYIDKHIYEQDHDGEKIYEYLRQLFYVLAFKKSFFKTSDDYENYSSYAATQTYMRLTDKRQFLPDTDPNKMKKIKSVLNFIKRIMYPLKVNYQKLSFNEVIKYVEEENYDGKEAYDSLNIDLHKSISESTYSYLRCDIEQYLHTIQKVIKSVVWDTPYASDPEMCHRLYMSCLITFLKSITLSKKNIKKLNTCSDAKAVSAKFIESIYNDEWSSSITVFRLKENYIPYINALTARVRKYCGADIKNIMSDYEANDSIFQAALIGEFFEGKED